MYENKSKEIPCFLRMVDYKEVKRKNGNVLISCNFEDLLKEAYGVKTMDEVLPMASGDEYICHCPFCKAEGHTKHKLYIKTDLTVGHCFVCTRNFINLTDEVKTEYKIPNFLGFMGSPGPLELVRLTDPIWSLDKFKYEFDDFSQEGYDYLIGRHGFMSDLYKVLDFKFMDGNIVMPFKYHGEIFYYQIRFSGSSNIRYFFPPISAKPPYIIEKPVNKNFIICEGVFDAIACLIMAPDYTPFAVLGSSISEYQMKFLREYVPEKILVYMDETKISNRIAENLKQEVGYCPIGIIRSTGEDPEENLKKRLAFGKPLQWIK